jgi:penicillin-binding protein 2
VGLRRRLTVLLLAAAAVSSVIWLRVFQLQALEGERWSDAARALREKRERTTSPRGRILTRDGAVLAEDVPIPRVVIVPWEWERRARSRCTACGMVHHPSRPGRAVRRCGCRLPGATLEALPPGDLSDVERGLGLEPGAIAATAERRIEKVEALAEAHAERLRAEGEEEFFVDDKKEMFLDDMLRRPHPIPDVVVPLEVVRAVELDEDGRTQGLRIETTPRRVHPQGDLVPQLLGYTAPIFREDFQRLRAEYGAEISPDMQIGRRGLERTYDPVLRGSAGSRLLARDEDGSFTVLLDEERPRPGLDLRLTASAAALREAQRLLDLHAKPEGYSVGGRPSAAFVALYADTGEIVAWAEAPRFDPDRDLSRISDPAWNDARFVEEIDPSGEPGGAWHPAHDLPAGETLDTWRSKVVKPDAVVLSRVFEVPVEPGSTMKTLIALAMLESGRGLPWQHYVCTGHGDKPTCHYAHGGLDIVEALGVSCNRWFAFTLGASPLTAHFRTSVAEFVDRVGFGRPVFADAIGARGRGVWLRERAWRADEQPRIGVHDVRYVAIGQGPVTTTPLHMARVAALVANGGRLVTPHVVASVGGTPQSWPATEMPLAPGSLAQVREGMHRVVNAPGGTAAKVDWDRVPASVYGKTGTAQVGRPYRPGPSDKAEDGPWHHWFMGWAEAPGQRPVAFCALLFARTEAAAGSTAAPLAADFLAWWFSGERP